jgi:hypothetical protein
VFEIRHIVEYTWNMAHGSWSCKNIYKRCHR